VYVFTIRHCDYEYYPPHPIPQVVAKEVATKLLDTKAAQVASQSLGKLFYMEQFRFIIRHLNTTLVTNENTKVGPANYIGVLDIAGFESFETNSLEQLFINLSNETLQQ
jgi:myosin heavy subunit